MVKSSASSSSSSTSSLSSSSFKSTTKSMIKKRTFAPPLAIETWSQIFGYIMDTPPSSVWGLKRRRGRRGRRRRKYGRTQLLFTQRKGGKKLKIPHLEPLNKENYDTKLSQMLAMRCLSKSVNIAINSLLCQHVRTLKIFDCEATALLYQYYVETFGDRLMIDENEPPETHDNTMVVILDQHKTCDERSLYRLLAKFSAIHHLVVGTTTAILRTIVTTSATSATQQPKIKFDLSNLLTNVFLIYLRKYNDRDFTSSSSSSSSSSTTTNETEDDVTIPTLRAITLIGPEIFKQFNYMISPEFANTLLPSVTIMNFIELEENIRIRFQRSYQPFYHRLQRIAVMNAWVPFGHFVRYFGQSNSGSLQRWTLDCIYKFCLGLRSILHCTPVRKSLAKWTHISFGRAIGDSLYELYHRDRALFRKFLSPNLLPSIRFLDCCDADWTNLNLNHYLRQLPTLTEIRIQLERQTRCFSRELQHPFPLKPHRKVRRLTITTWHPLPGSLEPSALFFYVDRKFPNIEELYVQYRHTEWVRCEVTKKFAHDDLRSYRKMEKEEYCLPRLVLENFHLIPIGPELGCQVLRTNFPTIHQQMIEERASKNYRFDHRLILSNINEDEGDDNDSDSDNDELEFEI